VLDGLRIVTEGGDSEGGVPDDVVKNEKTLVAFQLFVVLFA
jgi:hypothetical protein